MHSWTVRKIVKTFEILNGISDDIIEHIRYVWNTSDLDDAENFTNYSLDKHQDYIQISHTHDLYTYFGSILDFSFGLSFLVNHPFSGLGPIHTDGARHCAINFPIQVDLENSNFMSAKTFDTKCSLREPDPNEPVNKNALRFEYEPEKYVFYNLRKPIVASTKVAHTAYNYSKDKRVLLSITPHSMTYDKTLECIPRDWF